ncbi:uncharacterized protein LOC128219700 isoform X1 [Mya arenaria]|uniref:uncharacterized protein LOC128219700 isoform X1 n=1 Tax=Mya arenaria TaxID=6604 RepID=UPI0022E261AD|nr:uncharacterized protein LOC128219700 isoform X1 [Mya arenaria]XP_052783582.1 uncharacterized protein LOC128219700 isoform X1 [Mya arenaria]XP_052783584.1 uncharacterized protein LOC128219700 isoform X1 [Mya arenaria]
MKFLTLTVLLSLSISAAHGSPDSDFQKVIDDYWEWRLMEAPEFASNIDVHTYDDRVEQFGLDDLDRRFNEANKFLSQLSTVPRDQLPSERQVSYDILNDTLEVFTAGYKWKNYGQMNPVNFLEGMWTDISYFVPTKFSTYEDFVNYYTRVYGWGDQALNYIRRMRVAISKGTTNHWVSMNASIGQIEALIGSSNTNCPLYAPFNETLDNVTLPESNKTNLRTAAESVFTVFRDNFTALKTFIETEYKNASRTEYGVSSLPNGEDYYRACLRWHLSTDITPEEVHTLGVQEVARIHGQMMQVMAKLKFTGTVKEFFHMLNNNSTFIIQSKEETIKKYEEIIHVRIKPQLAKLFKNIPNNPVQVKEMPFDGPGGMYFSGSPDGTRPGVFYANVMKPANNPTYSMVALALHEADPGHHLQDIYTQVSTGVANFQRFTDYSKYFSVPYHFPFYTANSEGWGLYSESLGEKDYLDVYNDEYELMGRYSFEIFRACRLVVDTGLHYFNWTRDDAIEYVLNYTSLSRSSTETEIDRYITWPGQATAYKIGEIKIRQLRQRAMDELGSLFDIRDFHSIFLDYGIAPLSVIERLVEQWIRKEKESDSFEKISSEFWDWRMSQSREFSSSLGVYKYNDILDSYAYAKFDENKKTADDFLKRLSWIDGNRFTGEKKISFDVLTNILETFVAGYKWKDYQPLNPINFQELWFAGLDLFVDGNVFDTEGDFTNYVRRLELAPMQLDEMIELSKRAIANGTTNHNASVSRVPKNIDEMVVSPNESALYQPFLDSAERIFGNRADAIEKRLLDAIESLNSKLLEVKQFLINDYMPATRPGLGIGSLPNGKENYQACLYFHSSVNMTAEEVHNKGLEEVARIEKLIRQKMANVGFPESTSIQDMYANLTNDPKFILQSKAEILARFNELIHGRIEPLIPKYFKHAPSLPLEVRGSSTDGTNGEYWVGTPDGSRPGYFMINLFSLENNPTFKMVSLSLHEALPGHHLAESYGILADIPKYMQNFEWISYSAPYFFPFYNSFAEGWALYAEYLGEEMGIYQNDYEMLGRYSDEMLRAVRLVIDTGIHHYGWTRDKAINYMLNYTAETQSSTEAEIDRYCNWPGQAVGYKIGELKIKELRQRATTALGDKFDLAEFHYTVLRYGALPLDILEHVIDKWIADQKQDANGIAMPECKNPVSGVSRNIPHTWVVALFILMLNL